MNRRAFVTGLGAVLAAPRAAEAQHTEKVFSIGVLINAPASSPVFARRIEAFRRGLHDLDYVEGRNLALEYRWSGGTEDRLSELAAELVHHKVDLIVTHSVGGLLAKRATTIVPIVMASMLDPVGAGLVASLARPGGNVTGLSLGTGEGFAGKWLHLLKEAVPKLSRAAVLWNRANPVVALQVNALEAAGKMLGVGVERLEFRGADQIEAALSASTAKHPDGLVVPNDAAAFVQRQLVIAFAARNRLPTIYPTGETVEIGGLMSYAPSQIDSWRRAATYVDKILKGAQPADLPIEQPTKFELVINLKTAKALGLTIPPSLLLRADQVIE